MTSAIELRKSDSLGLMVIISRLMLMALFGLLTYFAVNWNIIAGLTVYYLYCIIWNFSSWSGIGHELSHKSVFRSRPLNDAFLVFFSYLTFTNHRIFRITHSEHHRDTHGPTDFESPIKANLHRTPTVAGTLCSIIDINRLFNTFKYLCLNSGRIIPDQALISLVDKCSGLDAVGRVATSRLVYLSIIALASLILWSPWPFVLLVLPNYIGTSLSKNLALVQHPSLSLLESLRIQEVSISNAKIPLANFNEEQIRDRIDAQLPPVLSFLYANMNYHATHHLKPFVPTYRLASASKYLSDRGDVGVISLHWYAIARLFISPL